MTVSTRRRYDVDSLLAVAVAVFTERGYDGTSMEDLARASGLSKSSLYHHIDSKEQLLRLALERAVEPLFAVTQEPGAVDGRAIDRLEHVVRREVEVLAERLPYVTLLLRVHGNTEAERWALERRREFDRFVAGLVREAAADAQVPVEPELAVLAVDRPQDGQEGQAPPGQSVDRRAVLGDVLNLPPRQRVREDDPDPAGPGGDRRRRHDWAHDRPLGLVEEQVVP